MRKRVSIDYLNVTFKMEVPKIVQDKIGNLAESVTFDYDDTLNNDKNQRFKFLSFLGIRMDSLKVGGGRYGYPFSASSDGFLIAWKPEGVLYSLSGAGCEKYRVTERLKEILEYVYENGGEVTRLDIAVDVVENDVFTITDFDESFTQNLYVSRKKTLKRFQEFSETGELKGYTVYLGNPRADTGTQGNIYLRLYRKDLELKSKSQPLPTWAGEAEIIERYEISINGKRKTRDVVRLILLGKSLIELHSSLLLNMIRFKKQGRNKQKTRWKDDPRWLAFLDNQDVFVSTETKERNLLKTLEWVKTSVLPTLVLLQKGAEEQGLSFDFGSLISNHVLNDDDLNKNQSDIKSRLENLNFEELNELFSVFENKGDIYKIENLRKK